MDIEKATKFLLEKEGTQFDRRVVLALANFVENKQGRELLSELARADRQVSAPTRAPADGVAARRFHRRLPSSNTNPVTPTPDSLPTSRRNSPRSWL